MGRGTLIGLVGVNALIEARARRPGRIPHSATAHTASGTTAAPRPLCLDPTAPPSARAGGGSRACRRRSRRRSRRDRHRRLSRARGRWRGSKPRCSADCVIVKACGCPRTHPSPSRCRSGDAAGRPTGTSSTLTRTRCPPSSSETPDLRGQEVRDPHPGRDPCGRRTGVHLSGSSHLDDHALSHHRDPIRHGQRIRPIVRDHQRSAPHPLVDPRDLPQQPARAAGSICASGSSNSITSGLTHQRARQGDSLTLTGRELVGETGAEST